MDNNINNNKAVNNKADELEKNRIKRNEYNKKNRDKVNKQARDRYYKKIELGGEEVKKAMSKKVIENRIKRNQKLGITPKPKGRPKKEKLEIAEPKRPQGRPRKYV